MKNKLIKMISLFLSLAILITIIPMGIYAADTEESKEIQVYEIEELRDLYSKTYKTSEDTNILISSAVPLHYEKNGELVEIDNTLVESDSDKSILTNKSNTYSVEFPSKYSSDSEISVEYEGHEISFKMLEDGMASSKASIDKESNFGIDEEDARSVAYKESNMSKLSSQIVYKDVLKNTDIEYTVEYNKLKESIVLEAVPENDYIVSFELNIGDLSAKLRDDNSVAIINNNGDELFIIEHPYMFDSNGNSSTDIKVSINETDGVYTYICAPDYSWLSGENISYPVTIDPTVTIPSISNSSQNIEDTFVSNYSVNDNYCDESTVIVQNNSSETSYGYYNFNYLPSLPSGSNILNSYFNVYLIYDSENNNTSSNNISLHSLSNGQNIGNSFIENVTWSDSISFVNEPIDVDVVDGDSEDLYKFDITTLVRKWYADNSNNRIICLKSLNNSLPLELASAEYDDTDFVPTYSIEYVSTNGISNKYSYHEQNMSLAGMAYINDYSGSLTIERTDFTSNGTVGDVTFYLGRDCNSPSSEFLGKNTSINYYKTLYIDSSSNKYILTNGDGSKVYVSDDDNYLTEVDSLNNQIVVSHSENDITISETFSANASTINTNSTDEAYILTKYSTTNVHAQQNGTHEVNIIYTNNHISRIEDEICKYEFSYASGKLSKIRQRSLITSDDPILSNNANSSAKDVSQYYKRTSSTEKVRYSYDRDDCFVVNTFENGNIVRVDNEFGGYYLFTYNNKDQVIRLQEYNSSNVAGDYLTFSYGNNMTIISDGQKTYTEYFDINGELHSIVDQDGNSIFVQYEEDSISRVSEIRNSTNYISDFYGFESGNDCMFTTNNGSAVLSYDDCFNGQRSVKLTTAANHNSRYTGTISGLEEDTTYTVSMWVKTNNDDNYSFSLTNDDYIVVAFDELQSVNDWQQIYCTIDAEEGNSLELSVDVTNSNSNTSSIIYVDNICVQKSSGITSTNLVSNGEFSNDISSWTSSSINNTVISNNDTISTEDANCLELVGTYTGTNTVSQTINISSINENDKYVIGAWMKAINAIPEKDSTNREFSITVYPVYSNMVGDSPLQTINYSTYSLNWKYEEKEIILNSDNVDNFESLTGLKISINYNYQMGSALVDGVSLLKDELYNLEFDYDSLSNPSGNEPELSANNSFAPEVPTYDSYGNIIEIEQSVTVENLTESIISKFNYSNQGSLLSSELNSLGYNTNYLYDYFGNVSSVTDANGNIINYEYDNFQNLSSIINTFELGTTTNNNQDTATLNVKYTYNGNRLEKIETGNIDSATGVFTAFNTYAFDYDSWCNLTDIYINDSNLETPYIHYEYDSNNYRQLNGIEYANGQEINYIFDNGNIIYQYDSNDEDGDTLAYSYFYLDNGICYAKKDLIANTTESYSGNITTLRDSNGNIIHSYSYDSNGNVIEQISDNEIKRFTTETEDGIQQKTKVSNSSEYLSSENVLLTKYDSFGRISEEHLSSGNGDSYILKEYTYLRAGVNENQSIVSENEEINDDRDEEFDSSEMPRYITYYSVDDQENKTKLFEYRYMYYPNGNTYTYTLVSGGAATAGETENETVEKAKLTSYNSGNMALYELSVSPNPSGFASNSSSLSGFLNDLSNYLNAGGESIEYDEKGNITTINTGNTAVDFTYDGSTSDSSIAGCLTGISYGTNDNVAISYDEMGNVTKADVSNCDSFNYNGIFDSANLNWSRGNTLDNIHLRSRTFFNIFYADVEIANYQYDDNNLRTHKTIDLGSQLTYLFNAPAIANADIEYIWNGNTLVGENIDCSGSIFNEFSGEDQINEAGKFNIIILYDNLGNAYGIVVNKTEDAYGNPANESETFYYLKDADNTITGLMDEEGNLVVAYEYDTFGTAATDHAEGYKYLMIINPLAYRDYVYDIETGMYYLQSRYYAPFAGRFISADDILDTGSGTPMSTNLYSYCENDPINNTDPYGYMKKHWYNKVSNVAKAIDVAIIVISTGKSIVGIKALRAFIKANRKRLIKTVEAELLKLIGTSVSALLPAAFDIALTLLGTSIGELIAKGIDYVDPLWKKGYIRNNGYILN